MLRGRNDDEKGGVFEMRKAQLFIFIFAVAALAYDSLNVRVHWTFHGTAEFAGLALAPDTTLWTCYPGTHTLIEIDASDPEAIDTNFYEMDSTIWGIADIIQDTILLVMGWNGTNQAIYPINIADDPPSSISFYESPYLAFWHAGSGDSRIIIDDSILITPGRTDPAKISIFDLSEINDIDTFSTGLLVYTVANWFSVKDSFIFITDCGTAETDPPYNLRTFISVVNIADPRNPVYDTTIYAFHENWLSPAVPIPSVVVHDTLLFLASNYDESPAPIADVYNISDPTNPYHVGSVGDYLSERSKRCIAFQNDYLYAGMYIYDLQGYPDTDSLIGLRFGEPQWLEVNGEFIYLIQGHSFVIHEFYEFDTTRQAVLDAPPPRADKISISAYPNPFNSTCRIGIESGGWRVESVEIYDVNGRMVAEIIPPSPPFTRGEEEGKSPLSKGDLGGLVWTPNESLGSGIYLIRARFGSRSLSGAETTATKRVVYLK